MEHEYSRPIDHGREDDACARLNRTLAYNAPLASAQSHDGRFEYRARLNQNDVGKSRGLPMVLQTALGRYDMHASYPRERSPWSIVILDTEKNDRDKLPVYELYIEPGHLMRIARSSLPADRAAWNDNEVWKEHREWVENQVWHLGTEPDAEAYELLQEALIALETEAVKNRFPGEKNTDNELGNA